MTPAICCIKDGTSLHLSTVSGEVSYYSHKETASLSVCLRTEADRHIQQFTLLAKQREHKQLEMDTQMYFSQRILFILLTVVTVICPFTLHHWKTCDNWITNGFHQVDRIIQVAEHNCGLNWEQKVYCVSGAPLRMSSILCQMSTKMSDMTYSIPQITRMGLSAALNLQVCGKAASCDMEGLFVSEHWERCVPGL